MANIANGEFLKKQIGGILVNKVNSETKRHKSVKLQASPDVGLNNSMKKSKSLSA